MNANVFLDLPKEMITFLLAMIPAIDLKASIPIAILKFELAPQTAFLWSFLGSLLMGFLVFSLFRFLFEKFLLKIKIINKSWENSIGLLRKKYHKRFNLIEALIILFFMIMPIPGFGSFLGAIILIFLRTNFSKAIAYLIWGNFLAGGVIVLLIFGLNL